MLAIGDLIEETFLPLEFDMEPKFISRNPKIIFTQQPEIRFNPESSFLFLEIIVVPTNILRRTDFSKIS